MEVKLRKQKSGKGTPSLFLSYTIKGRRSRPALGMFLYTRPKNEIQKVHNFNTLSQAETIRANKQLELQGAAHGLEYIPESNQTFDSFFKEYLRNYPNKDIRKYEGAYTKFNDYL